jgi:hypothetical protein
MNREFVTFLTFVWCILCIITAGLWFKRPWIIFFVSAVASMIGIGVSMYFLGPYLDGGGLIHSLCIGGIAVIFSKFMKAIRHPKSRL